MSKIRVLNLLALTLSLIFSNVSAVSAQADNPPRKILTGWNTYYGSVAGYASVLANADLMQEITPFWYTLTDQNTITDLYTASKLTVPIQQQIDSLTAANLQLLPTITDGTNKGVLAGLLANSAARANIERAILNLVMSNKYAGIDLDFENFAFVDGNTTWPTTAPLWVQFIHELGDALHAQNKLLSVTTPVLFNPTTGKKGYYVYSWSGIAPYIDRLRIMSYDYSTSSPGPIGPLDWATAALQYAVSVIPASKIYLGVPGYGRVWVTKVTGVCPADVSASVSGAPAVFAMSKAQGLYTANGAVPTFNQQYAETSFTYQKTYNGTTKAGVPTSCTATYQAWYQDAQGFVARANLVGQFHIAGIAEWTLGMEDPSAMNAVRQVALSIAPDKVLAAISGAPSLLSYGDSGLFVGRFTLADGTAVVGIPVTIQVTTPDKDIPTAYTAVTGADGSVAINVIPSESTTVTMHSASTWTKLASNTQGVSIMPTRLISIQAPQSMKAGATYYVTGSVQPVAAGVSLTITDGRSVIGTGVSDASGNYSIAVTESDVGIYALHAQTASDARYLASASATATVLVR